VLARAGDGVGRLDIDIPREVDPGILTDPGNIGIDQRFARRFGIDGGNMRIGQQIAQQLGGIAAVDQIVDDQPCTSRCT